jgi:hypothetical protein
MITYNKLQSINASVGKLVNKHYDKLQNTEILNYFNELELYYNVFDYNDLELVNELYYDCLKVNKQIKQFIKL